MAENHIVREICSYKFKLHRGVKKFIIENSLKEFEDLMKKGYNFSINCNNNRIVFVFYRDKNSDWYSYDWQLRSVSTPRNKLDTLKINMATNYTSLRFEFDKNDSHAIKIIVVEPKAPDIKNFLCSQLAPF